mmetsp:Transcript_12742/g.50894  ORF Transcript_12742/g.50894 Transcript_12742/m.50894 type:complete len:176 (+) Transcript_12742:187-714(+)
MALSNSWSDRAPQMHGFMMNPYGPHKQPTMASYQASVPIVQVHTQYQDHVVYPKPSQDEYAAVAMLSSFQKPSQESSRRKKKELPPPLQRPTTIIERKRKKSPSTKRSKRASRITKGLRCDHCGTTKTPEWRSGPGGAVSLCNACGLNYRKNVQREALLPSQDTTERISLENLLR